MHSRMKAVGYLDGAVAFVAWKGTHLTQHSHGTRRHVTGFDTIYFLTSWTLKVPLLCDQQEVFKQKFCIIVQILFLRLQ